MACCRQRGVQELTTILTGVFGDVGGVEPEIVVERLGVLGDGGGVIVRSCGSVGRHVPERIAVELQTASGHPADLIVSLAEGYELYEIKTAASPRECIRQAFGQLPRDDIEVCEYGSNQCESSA